MLSISMVGPAWFSDGLSAAVLILMHVATGTVLILGFARFPYSGELLHLHEADQPEWHVPMWMIKDRARELSLLRDDDRHASPSRADDAGHSRTTPPHDPNSATARAKIR